MDTLINAGPVMIPLFLLSIFFVALVIVYLMTIRRGAVVSSGYMATADALLRKRDYLGLLAVSNRHGEAIARVVQKMLEFTTKNPNADFQQVREIAETEGTRVAAGLNNRVTYLADIGMIAPLIGLLVTVIGIFVRSVRSAPTSGRRVTGLFPRNQPGARQYFRRPGHRNSRDDVLRFFPRTSATVDFRTRSRGDSRVGSAFAALQQAGPAAPGANRGRILRRRTR